MNIDLSGEEGAPEARRRNVAWLRKGDVIYQTSKGTPWTLMADPVWDPVAEKYAFTAHSRGGKLQVHYAETGTTFLIEKRAKRDGK